MGTRRYEKMVEGLDGYGELVVRDAEIIPALQRAFESGNPACANVMTDPTVTSPATSFVLPGIEDGIRRRDEKRSKGALDESTPV